MSTTSSSALHPIVAMLQTLEPLGLAELERALRLRLCTAGSAAERRVAELGFLAQLLDEQPRPSNPDAVPRLGRSEYERRQPVEAPDAPSAQLLVDRYESWVRVCRAAYGLQPDGRTRGPGQPWVSLVRGKPRTPTYTRDEAAEAIRNCAHSLGRVPDASAYQRWSTEEKRLARLKGADTPRLPSLRVIYRLYPKGDNKWRKAIGDAGLVEGEIARSRITRVLRLGVCDALPVSPREALEAADVAQLRHVGIDAKRRRALLRDGFGVLRLTEAVALAQLLEGSLDWLVGIDAERGEAPTNGVRFDPSKVRELQEQREVDTATLRTKLGIADGPWRNLMSGKKEPYVFELAMLAVALNSRTREFVVFACE